MPESVQHDAESRRIETQFATPIAGAIAGILFALLFTASVSILIKLMSTVGGDASAWLEPNRQRLELSLSLMPFAGIFFLWFIGVARSRLGRFEDQFFSTVILGSGLLFLVMVFVAAATAGAISATYAKDPSGYLGSDAYLYARFFIAQIFSVYALRMAAVFLASQATIWMRTGVMPRWLAFISYVTALVLLFIVKASPWVLMVFPAWVFLVSAYILITKLRPARPQASAA